VDERDLTEPVRIFPMALELTKQQLRLVTQDATGLSVARPSQPDHGDSRVACAAPLPDEPRTFTVPTDSKDELSAGLVVHARQPVEGETTKP
jgi:hypothetical protein